MSDRSDEPAAQPAIFVPYLVGAPFPFAVMMAMLGAGMANALKGSVVSNLLMGFFLTYLLLLGPALAFAWMHRRAYRASGQHRPMPVLGLAAGIAVPALMALLAMPGQQGAPTAQDILILMLAVVGGLTSLAMIGFTAVWLIDRRRLARPA